MKVVRRGYLGKIVTVGKTFSFLNPCEKKYDVLKILFPVLKCEMYDAQISYFGSILAFYKYPHILHYSILYFVPGYNEHA